MMAIIWNERYLICDKFTVPVSIRETKMASMLWVHIGYMHVSTGNSIFTLDINIVSISNYITEWLEN